MKIYTKTGDSGETSLVYGKRVLKSNLKIETYGTIDELNSNIGLLRDQPVNEKRIAILGNIQEKLFVIGSNLASEKEINSLPKLTELDIQLLENEIDSMNLGLENLKHFILPGGHISVSVCHIVRTVCRRAERIVINLNEIELVNPLIIRYLNRLSDYFFVLARKMGNELGVKEILWEGK